MTSRGLPDGQISLRVDESRVPAIAASQNGLTIAGSPECTIRLLVGQFVAVATAPMPYARATRLQRRK